MKMPVYTKMINPVENNEIQQELKASLKKENEFMPNHYRRKPGVLGVFVTLDNGKIFFRLENT